MGFSQTENAIEFISECDGDHTEDHGNQNMSVHITHAGGAFRRPVRSAPGDGQQGA